jgi:predicted transcriptional regulator
MTPDECRIKWSLPASYPMVAADYAMTRSKLAKDSGLGRKPEMAPIGNVRSKPESLKDYLALSAEAL